MIVVALDARLEHNSLDKWRPPVTIGDVYSRSSFY